MATRDIKEIVYLPLEGVESEHCAMIIDKGLAQVKGIETHKVELNNRRCRHNCLQNGSSRGSG